MYDVTWSFYLLSRSNKVSFVFNTKGKALVRYWKAQYLSRINENSSFNSFLSEKADQFYILMGQNYSSRDGWWGEEHVSLSDRKIYMNCLRFYIQENDCYCIRTYWTWETRIKTADSNFQQFQDFVFWYLKYTQLHNNHHVDPFRKKQVLSLREPMFKCFVSSLSQEF